MNNIPLQQNSERHLDQLAAQRQLYSTAKTIFGWHSFFSVPITILIAVFSFSYQEIKPYAALWGMGLSLADLVWLTPWTKRLRNKAASIQEAFDCELFELQRDDLRTGKFPDPELIKSQSDKYKKNESKMPTLLNWYDKSVGEIPIYLARLACQRSNCWWDSTQRRHYANLILSFAILVFLSILLPAVFKNISIHSFILALNTLMPVFVLCYRQYNEHVETAARLDTLKDYIEKTWKEALFTRNEVQTTLQSRKLQSEIFENRKKGPLVFDFVFKHLRNDYEAHMNHGARFFVDEARQVLKQ